MTKPVLNSDRLTLRDAVEADIEARFALGNDPQIQALLGADPKQVRPLTRDAAAAWVASIQNDATAWVIEADLGLIGSIRLHSMNHMDKRANVAIGILAATAAGQGLGSDALRLLARHSFETLGLHRLSARILADNAGALSAYNKVGFIEEGRERESALVGDHWQDDVILGLLQRDLRL